MAVLQCELMSVQSGNHFGVASCVLHPKARSHDQSLSVSIAAELLVGCGYAHSCRVGANDPSTVIDCDVGLKRPSQNVPEEVFQA